MVIGANGDMAGLPGYNDRNSHAGSAYVFKRDSTGKWHQFQKLLPSVQGHRATFGGYLAFSGKYIVIGAAEDSWAGSRDNYVDLGGAAFVFKEDSTGLWVETQKLTGHSRKVRDRFGWGMGISDSMLLIASSNEEVVTMNGDTLIDAGAVYSYRLDSNGVWQEMERITACSPRAYAIFGFSVSVSNNKAIIGAPHSNEAGHRMAGAAYFYYLTDYGYWQGTSKVLEENPQKDFRFGQETALSEDCFIIAAPRSGSSRGGGPVHKKWGEVYILNTFPKAIKCAAEKLSTYSLN